MSAIRIGILALSMSLPAAAGVEEGLAAMKAGDAGAALAELRGPAESGDPRAQVAMGVLHGMGKGVEKDPVAARQWFERAANQGHADGQFQFGVALLNGVGIDPDKTRACMFFRLAAAQEHVQAQEGVQLCQSMLKKKELELSARLAAEWRPAR